MSDQDTRTLDRRILALAVPALATLAIEPTYLLVDTAIVGRLGTAPLGGLAIASTVLSSLVYLCSFLSTGTTARVAFLTGRGDDAGATGIVPQALWLAAGIGLTISAFVAVFARTLATALGGEGVVLDNATTYLRISAISLPAVLVVFVGNGYLRGRSDTRTPLRVILVANVVNVVLEVLFVYGLDYGIAGSAWGTVIAQLVSGAWFLTILARRMAEHGVRFAPDAEQLRRLVRVGRQIIVRTASLLGALAIATSVAARFGPATLGGHQIAIQVWFLLALSMDALAVAAQAIVGTALGRDRPDDARAAARRTIQLGLVLGVVLAALILASSPFLPHLFSTDPAVLDRARLALLMVAVTQVPASMAFVLDGVLEGASDFRFLKWALLGALAVFAPLAVSARLLDLGIVGLWAALLVWLCVRAGALALRFRGTRWLESVHG